MSAGRVSLRVVLFHSVSDAPSDFTEGLGVTMREADFRERIDFLRRRYHPVDIEAVRAAAAGEQLPPRALLVTIDDAYASVADTMAAMLDDAGLPSVFFVNGAFVDHGLLGTDNLVTFTANTLGAGALQSAADQVSNGATVTTIDDALGAFVPTLDQETLGRFRAALIDRHDRDPLDRAKAERLYVDSGALRSLPESMAIGSHTSSHVRCRTLGPADFGPEIVENRDRLKNLTPRWVDAFSVPYGSRSDLTPEVASAVAECGHDLVFLVEGQLNHGPIDPGRLVRVSLKHTTDLGTLTELEAWPRVRRLRDSVLRRPARAPQDHLS